MGCSCEKKPCAGGTPPRVLEVNTVCGPVLFHRVDYPATAGTPTTNPPETLNYRNVLLVYEATGEVYLYSSDGVPTFISYLPTNVDALKQVIEEEIAAREAAIAELQADLNAEAEARQSADEALTEQNRTFTEQLTGVETAQKQLKTEVSNLNSTVTEASQQLSTLQEDLETETTNREEADTKLQQNIDALENKSDVVDVVGTYAELEAYDTKNLGDNDIIKVLSDETHNGAITYYRFNKATGTFSYVGETGPYYTKAEIDTDLEGIDHDIENLTQLVEGISVPHVPNTILTGFSSPSFTRAQNNFTINFNEYTPETQANAVSDFTIPPAASGYAGLMSSADKEKLDALLEIKSLNDSLELDENGQLSVVGGGSSDVNLLSSYTATVNVNDAYDASYVNSRLDNGNILIGVGASSGDGSGIAIGRYSAARSKTAPSVAIGQQAVIGVGGQYGLAVGYTAHVGDLVSSIASYGKYGVALGYGAIVYHEEYSVALGSSSKTARNYEVSIGSGSTTQLYGTRFLANVTAGELPTDAVNLKQMQDYVAENAGNPFTEMETTRVQNLPPAVVTGFEDTTYGTDTVTMHLDTKDLATGGASVQELELEGATANTATEGGHAGLMTAFQATQLAALAEAGVEGTMTTEEFNAAWEAA